MRRAKGPDLKFYERLIVCGERGWEMGGRISAIVQSQEKRGNLLGWCSLICSVFLWSVVRRAHKGDNLKIILSIKRQRLRCPQYPDTHRDAPRLG